MAPTIILPALEDFQLGPNSNNVSLQEMGQSHLTGPSSMNPEFPSALHQGGWDSQIWGYKNTYFLL